ncbi:branched-chain amino acid transporter ATP-binding protein [Alicycliphilus sp. B1]|jgi:branched-chain amino acid transport system ATP-binding protein|nr:branched-chain amino acid transporter ATP-binding protein [Alicycliphilus sp. B1]
MSTPQVLLHATQVTKRYGDFVALSNVDLSLHGGEFVSVVGPNGAGKSTLVNVLTGLHKPSTGSVRFCGEDIAGVGPVELATRGLARAFQLVNVFPELTVRETLSVAACSHLRTRWSLFSNVHRDDKVRAIVDRTMRAFGLERDSDTPANSLPHGRRKLLDVASAFALHPRVMLLDEPTAGVSTADKDGVMTTLLDAAKHLGVEAILLVEHDMDLVARYSSRIVAMMAGQKIADEPTEAFFRNEEALAIVVGKGH